MSKSLAELRASTRTSLPIWSYSLCLAQGLVAEVQAIEEQLLDLRVPRRDPDDDGPPRRLAEGPSARVVELEDRKAALYEEMREHTGEIRLQGKPAGEWRRFVDANPPRKDNKADEAFTYGLCDADALLASLGDFVVSWNGDPLGEGDWDFIANRAPAGDLKEMCRQVVQLHEMPGARAPKSQKSSSTTGTSEPSLT